MRSSTVRDGWFVGTWALVRSRRRFLVAVPVYGVLLPGLASGLLLGVLGQGPHREIGEGVALLIAGVVLGVPIGLGALWTFGPTAAGLPGRRQELFALPLGRLAIPGAVLVGSAIALALAALAAWVVSTTVGGVLVASLEMLARRGGPTPSVDVFLAGVACFGMGFVIGTVGASTAHGPLVLVLPGVAACILAQTTGHGALASARATLLSLGAFALYSFAVPFALYRRAPHHWAYLRVPGQDRADLYAAATSMATLLGLVFAGGVVALAMLAIGAGVTALVARRERALPRRRSWPHLRVAHAIALGLVVPLAVVGIVADARLVESVSPANPAIGAARHDLAPGGRRLAVELRAAESSLRRVAVLDLTGAASPWVAGARFATIGGWSADGRSLALHDETIGRLPLPFSELTGLLVADGGLTWLLRLRDAVGETVVLDVDTGETVARRRPLLVAPGWATFAELVHVERRTADELVLADGDGRRYAARMRGERLAIPVVGGGEIELALPTLAGYAGGRPVLAQKHQRWRWDADGLAPLADASEWRVPDDEDRSQVAWTPESALVLEADGLYRVHLPGLERERLVVRRANELVRVHALAPSVGAAVPALAHARIVEVGDALYVVTPTSPAALLGSGTCARRLDLIRWAEAPLLFGLASDGAPVAERLARDTHPEPLELVPDGSVLVRDGNRRLVLVRPDGTRRKVLGE